MTHDIHESEAIYSAPSDGKPNTSHSATDLHSLSPSELISRITTLETKLKKTTAQLTALTSSHHCQKQQQENIQQPTKILKKPPKPFDPALYSTRHIALKFSYIGTEYNGYEHTNNATSAPEKPTIEEVIWKALRKGRLISPEIPHGADQSYDVVWDPKQRAQRYGVGTEGEGRGKRGTERLELVWDGLGYSKCGRTDRGVSAFGQVIGVMVRSNKPLGKRKQSKRTEEVEQEVVTGASHVSDENENGNENDTAATDGVDQEGELSGEENGETVTRWDSVRDEMPYISILNNLLPPSIRILAWCPEPPPSFDARFFCKERRYKYLFTNPAMNPIPGKIGMTHASGVESNTRDGWLDIEAMRKAAKKLQGLHDYRNFCKIDASKQMSSCERRVTHADIEEFGSGVEDLLRDSKFSQTGSAVDGFVRDLRKTIGIDGVAGPKVYAFTVHGTAFLWHQVRCMVAILFLVGQGLEQPDIVDKLLDIETTPGRPIYMMADDAPLVLWDCVFPGDDPGEEDGMTWVYPGDQFSGAVMVGKRDDKFGPGGLIERLWNSWREAKIMEMRAAGLLGLVLSQGNSAGAEREDVQKNVAIPKRSQRLFDGSSEPRYVGDYVPLMQRKQLETLEVLNARYAARKGISRGPKDIREVVTGED